MLNLMQDTLIYVFQTLIHNAPWLFLGILMASAIRVYLDPEQLRALLSRSSKISIPSSVAFGALTPFCACGTMAVVVSMLTTVLPWGPIMAFLTSSPLMSPDFFILLSGIVSVEFASVLLLSSVLIGLGSGLITHLIEKHTSWLEQQARFKPTAPMRSQSTDSAGSLPDFVMASTPSCCSISGDTGALVLAENPLQRYKLDQLLKTMFEVGVKQILLFFTVFAAIGYWINLFVPEAWILSLFGSQNLFAVPMAALLGIPLYISGSSSIPLINALMSGGASGGVLLAFMITGPGTSMGAITGILTIMKRRAVLLYVGYLFAGAVLMGYGYNAYLYFSQLI